MSLSDGIMLYIQKKKMKNKGKRKRAKPQILLMGAFQLLAIQNTQFKTHTDQSNQPGNPLGFPSRPDSKGRTPEVGFFFFYLLLFSFI